MVTLTFALVTHTFLLVTLTFALVIPTFSLTILRVAPVARQLVSRHLTAEKNGDWNQRACKYFCSKTQTR